MTPAAPLPSESVATVRHRRAGTGPEPQSSRLVSRAIQPSFPSASDPARYGYMAYFSTWCPAGTAIETLVAVEGQRWAVEDGFEVAKTELGLDHNETRSWHGWHRHVSLGMLALAMLATIRHRANSGREKSQLPKLRRQIQAARPLVGAGSSPHRRAAGATAH
jgi:SRSO17 transposase